MKIIVGITGASGSIYGLKLIEVLKNAGHQVHVVISDSGLGVIQYECDTTLEDIALVADKIYNVHNVGAAIASGSFQADAMVIAPCSMNTCGCLAGGITDNLCLRITFSSIGGSNVVTFGNHTLVNGSLVVAG